jgi:Secretion system C-terminal sorting domain
MTHHRILILFFLFSAAVLTSAISETAHGQRSWARVNSGLVLDVRDGGQIQFSTADTGFLIINGDSLVRTTDAGQSWAKVDLPSIGPRGNFLNMVNFFGSSGWYGTYEVDANLPENVLTRLLHTTDFGSTWSLTQWDSSVIIPAIYFKSPSMGYMMWSDVFYISTDSGNTWQARPLPPSGPDASGEPYAVGPPNVILGQGYDATKNQNDYYVSTDTGATWDSTGQYMAYIGNDTWVTRNAWSTNNGQTFDTVPTTASLYENGVTTDTLGHGMFPSYELSAGSNSVLYFTNDYGHSWDSATVPFKVFEEGVIIGDVWYVLAIDSGASTYSLYRSPAPSSSVSQTIAPPQFQILTNPATHALQLSLEEIPDEIRIVDFLGRTVASYSTQGGAFSVDVSALPAGLYWVVTRSGAQSFVHLSE